MSAAGDQKKMIKELKEAGWVEENGRRHIVMRNGGSKIIFRRSPGQADRGFENTKHEVQAALGRTSSGAKRRPSGEGSNE